jgi:hypothetical protein
MNTETLRRLYLTKTGKPKKLPKDPSLRDMFAEQRKAEVLERCALLKVKVGGKAAP